MIFDSLSFIFHAEGYYLVRMVVMTMIGRVIDGLPLAASMQSDEDVCINMYIFTGSVLKCNSAV